MTQCATGVTRVLIRLNHDSRGRWGRRTSTWKGHTLRVPSGSDERSATWRKQTVRTVHDDKEDPDEARHDDQQSHLHVLPPHLPLELDRLLLEGVPAIDGPQRKTPVLPNGCGSMSPVCHRSSWHRSHGEVHSETRTILR